MRTYIPCDTLPCPPELQRSHVGDMMRSVGSVGLFLTENVAMPGWFSATVILTSPPLGCLSVTSIHSSGSR